MCRARLPEPSPPWCRRWRLVFPEEAGIGATPQSRAKAASERSRSGLSPMVTRSALVVSTPMANVENVVGATAATSSPS